MYFGTIFIPENPEGLVNSNEKEQSSCNVSRGDILITRTSESLEEVGMTSVALKDYPNSTFNGFSKRLRIKKNAPIEISPLFMGYLLRTRFFRKSVANYATMTTRASLNGESIKSIPLSFPSFPVQEEIGKTLHSLEKKIALLRQQNQTLEELAQTLFKRWFVEFEFPNENGVPYKSFGGKMVESELGEIPEGWRVGEVRDHVKHSTKSVSPSKEPEKEFYHYSIPAYDKGRYPTIDFGVTVLSNKYEVINNSILVSKLNPATSRIWPIFTPKTNAICSTEIQVFIPKKYSYSFSFGLFHFAAVKKEMAQRASGTSSSHQRVRPGDILNIECIVPENKILQSFEKAVLGLLQKVEVNQEEIQTLTQFRDIMLPKLMSGELRVEQ